MADEEIIYIHKGVDSTRSKISNNWTDKFGKCKNCITNAKDKNVGNIIMPVQRYTNIFPVVLIKPHLPVTFFKVVCRHITVFANHGGDTTKILQLSVTFCNIRVKKPAIDYQPPLILVYT